MKEAVTAIAISLLIVISTLSSSCGNGLPELESPQFSNSSNDGYGPTNYTDEHTYVTVGEEGRFTLLRMPGGHDYSKPLPLVVALHGFGGSGQGNAHYMTSLIAFTRTSTYFSTQMERRTGLVRSAGTPLMHVANSGGM